MAYFNTFIVDLPLESGTRTTCEFQARVGVLEDREVRIGEPISTAPFEEVRGTIGPSLEALSSKRPFWVYGIGVCGGSDVERCAKLHFRDGVFASAELVECPDNLYEWGFEEP
jgi:hypothetical protein